MAQPHFIAGQGNADQEQMIDTMISLTRLAPLQRAIVAGRDSLKLYLSLRRRGFLRTGTPATCRIPRGQHNVGLIAGGNSLAEIEASLLEIARFLAASATIAVLVDARESGIGVKVHDRLEQLGFRVDAGARCSQGFILSASRQDFIRMKSAA